MPVGTYFAANNTNETLATNSTVTADKQKATSKPSNGATVYGNNHLCGNDERTTVHSCTVDHLPHKTQQRHNNPDDQAHDH